MDHARHTVGFARIWNRGFVVTVFMTTQCAQCDVGSYALETTMACVACVTGSSDEDSDPATPCTQCESGAYAAGGASPCLECVAGTADLDLDASTACGDCASGTFASAGSTACDACIAGRTDSDATAATACVVCPRGQYNPTVGRAGDCDSCAAGRYAPAYGNEAVDACEECSTGQFAADASAACTACAVRCIWRESSSCSAAIICTSCSRGSRPVQRTSSQSKRACSSSRSR